MITRFELINNDGSFSRIDCTDNGLLPYYREELKRMLNKKEIKKLEETQIKEPYETG